MEQIIIGLAALSMTISTLLIICIVFGRESKCECDNITSNCSLCRSLDEEEAYWVNKKYDGDFHQEFID
jgi:hypothetical protein